MDHEPILRRLGIQGRSSGVYAGSWSEGSDGPAWTSTSPIDGRVLGEVSTATEQDVDRAVEAASRAFEAWRALPAPKRGAVIRDMGDAFRDAKRDLGALVTLEMGKILPEGEGEVQELIDIADFAVGLSRQLYGKTMHSERRHHRMYEQWHPLGVVGIITAFNFPVAVFGWNAMIAAVCGDTMVWKPSPKVPLTSIAVMNIAASVLEDHGHPGVMNLLVGDVPVGERLIADRRVPLVSATGSCRMGRRVAQVVGGRLGRTILELGGNNAVVVLADADMDLSVRAILFGAAGTAGQRCTTTRRVIVEEQAASALTERLLAAYRQIRVGDPSEQETLMGPLVDPQAAKAYADAVRTIESQGGEILFGGEVLDSAPFRSGCFVSPTLVKAPKDLPIMRRETFAPILYLVSARDLDEAIEIHNSVEQGLSSAIFTRSLLSAERFLSATGSDCGIANVNLGTSGAEIGGAFGGEKDTGGGREAGSDAWKAYMRRQTNTINFGEDLPLAQGIVFEAR